MVILFLLALVILGFLAALFVVCFRLQKTQAGSVSAGTPEPFSAARYRPMVRLLDESDFGLVARAPGHSRLLLRFRSERRSLFRTYLRDLRSDQAAILHSIRNLLVESRIDRPELAIALYRCQVMFTMALVSIECKLLLHATGFGTVKVDSLVAAVDRLQCQLQDMVFVRAVTCC